MVTAELVVTALAIHGLRARVAWETNRLARVDLEDVPHAYVALERVGDGSRAVLHASVRRALAQDVAAAIDTAVAAVNRYI